MSKITDVFNEIHTRINALLPDHNRLSDPYDIDKNNSLWLKLGYGVSINEGQFKEEGILNAGCKYATTRAFDVHITRKFYAFEHAGAQKDDVALQIMEDLVIITKDFLLNSTLNDGSSTTNISGDGGIFKIIVDKDNFLASTITVVVDYRDTL